MEKNTLEIPKGLKKQGKAFWQEVTKAFEIVDIQDQKRLEMASKVIDEILDAETEIKAGGMFVKNRYGTPIPHPGIKILSDLRILFLKIVRDLGLDAVEVEQARKLRGYGK